MSAAQELPRVRGFTLIEALTVLVVIVVLAAIAVPMWRNHLLRVRRADAMGALNALQVSQDRFFGRTARYATAATLTASPPRGLGLAATSQRGFYEIELRTADDGLSYLAIAGAVPLGGQAGDARCVQFSIDQSGIRRARDAAGEDRSADCWR
jgi:type IV pilus assembly protein PilE